MSFFFVGPRALKLKLIYLALLLWLEEPIAMPEGDQLIIEFGAERIDDEIIRLLDQVIEQRGLTRDRDKYLFYFTRGIFFSHRDLKDLLTQYLKGETFYLYTGRGPSSPSMHIGHLIPFRMTQLLQELFDVQVVIQLTDDEKFFAHEGKLSLETFHEYAEANQRDIMACGFNPDKTFVFINTEYMYRLYPVVVQIQKRINVNQIRAIFGYDQSASIGKVAFPAIQAAPAFSSCFPQLFTKPTRCLIPCATDQDPYFRMTRDIAVQMGFPKPALLHAQFLPSLQGINSKMSSTQPDSVIFLNDPDKVIDKKIKKAVSGGGDTLDLHRQHGANLAVDIPIQYLRFFLTDEAQYQSIRQSYKAGVMTTGEVKKLTIATIQAVVHAHQQARQL